MTFDPSKMSKEKWIAHQVGMDWRVTLPDGSWFNIGDALYHSEFGTHAHEIALLHNERLISERRRWFVMPRKGEWIAVGPWDHGADFLQRSDGSYFTGPHAIGLLTLADAYFEAKEEGHEAK